MSQVPSSGHGVMGGIVRRPTLGGLVRENTALIESVESLLKVYPGRKIYAFRRVCEGSYLAH